VYTHEQGRTAHVTRPATVVSVRPITLEGSQGVVGAIGGGVLGAVIGNTVGGGSGKTVAQVAGALGGAAAGGALEGAVTKKDGVEITVQFEDGTQMAIPQQVSPYETFQPGQRVSVLNDGMGVYRVRAQ
jgi:outer membrane lipoprotein SlyB